jgi:hypothetical protein
VELSEFETRYHDLNDTMSEATWSRVDALIAAAGQAGLHVILTLSGYGQSLQVAGLTPTTTDWGPYLKFIASRVNTRTATRYADDPTIAMIQLYGEIDAPNYGEPGRGTTAETTAFFQRTLAQLRAIDSNHLLNTGGLSYINDPNSGIDWRTIVAGADNDVCAVEINSYDDRNISVPNISSYCQQLGKPWFLAAWSACLKNPAFAGDISAGSSDDQLAAHARDMYDVERRRPGGIAPLPAVPAVGSAFWALGRDGGFGTCDIGPQFPRALAVIQATAP